MEEIEGGSAAAAPVPVREMVWVPGESSSVTVTTAVLIPVADGLNDTVMLQLAPGATCPVPAELMQVDVPVKSDEFAPVSVILEMFSGAPPLLVSVTALLALVVPTAWLPKPNDVAEST